MHNDTRTPVRARRAAFSRLACLACSAFALAVAASPVARAHHPQEQLVVCGWTSSNVNVYDAIAGSFAEAYPPGGLSLAHSVRIGPD